MNFVSKTSNKGSPQIKTSKLIKVAHQIRKQPWEKIPKLIIVGATTIRQVRVHKAISNLSNFFEKVSQVASLGLENTKQSKLIKFGEPRPCFVDT